jgi:6-phospho-beta-glucosidase
MLDARINDEKIPLKHGLIGQETTGIGGFMKALRTIPVILDVAEIIRECAPEAWLINFANPAGLVTEALANYTSVKVMGLCNGPIGMTRNAQKLVPAGAKEIVMNYIGLNHYSWVTEVYCDGVEVMKEGILGKPDLWPVSGVLGRPVDEHIISHVRAIPSGYLAYYYYQDEMLSKLKKVDKSRGEVCKEIERELLELYEDPNLNEKPAVLDQRGGAMYSEVAVSLIDAIVNDKGDVHMVNVMNRGTLDFMDNDDVIEVNCTVGRDGPTPIRPNGFDNAHAVEMTRMIKRYEKAAARAAVTGDYRAAIDSMLLHPLGGDYARAKAAFDELLDANRRFLPRFFS